MFNGAISFNQNLCKWRDIFPYSGFGTGNNFAFKDSGCTFPEGPNEVDKSPFCASEC